MSNDLVYVLNGETGETGTIRRKLFENPRINNGILTEVDPGQKPYVPELWRSKLTEDHDEDEDQDVLNYDFTDSEEKDK